MKIVNQDRDQAYMYDPRAPLYSVPVFREGQCYGLNLMMGTMFLGTFDSPAEIIREMRAILTCRGPKYRISAP